MQNEYQKREELNAQELANSFKDCGFNAYVKKGNDNNDYLVIVETSGREYQARKWRDNNIMLSEYPYKHYKTVSSYKAGEIHKNIFVSNNMKVLTSKKISEKIKEIDTYHETLTGLEVENIQKQIFFLSLLSVYKDVKYSYKKEYNDKNELVNTEEITGGEMIKNGIVFEFEICQDGYIKQDVKLHYSIPNDLKSFLALSENKYIKND